MDRLPLSSAVFQAKAAELRRMAKDFESAAARRRAAIILEKLEHQACVAEGGVSTEDGVLLLD